MKIQSFKDLEKISQEYRKKLYHPDFTKVNIGMASCGIAAGARASYDKAIKAFPVSNGVRIWQTGCIGFCQEEPLVEILEEGKSRVVYKHVTEDKICDVIQGYMDGNFDKKLILGQMRDPRCLLEETVENPVLTVEPLDGIPFLEDIPFYNRQIKIALCN